MSPIGLMTDTLLNKENVNDENQLDKKKINIVWNNRLKNISTQQ